MQEESRWRDALVQQIASYAHATPKVAAVLVEGSVARDDSDPSSNIDLAVFWACPPTTQERRDIVTRAAGRSRRPSPSHREVAGWETRTVRAGVAIDVRHTTVAATEGILATVLERADPSLSKQQHLAALRSALPLVNPSAHQPLAAASGGLSARPGRGDGTETPASFAAWEQEQLAERKDVLVLYDSFCTAQKQLLLVLLGLNCLYYPGWRWLDRLLGEMQVAPPNLSPRLKQLFAIVSIDPLASVYQFHELIEETFVLVETHLPAVDTSGRCERGFTSNERPGNTRPVDSCRGFAGVGVETPSNRLTDNQGMQVILTRFRLCCFSPSCSSHSTSSNTTRSASVPPPEAFSLLLPPSLTHSPCHAVLLPPPVQKEEAPEVQGCSF